jgi:tetratricopeptide (TPR) repeat protein
MWYAAVLSAGLMILGGCASMRHRGAVPEAVATCRELSRQGATAVEAGQWNKAEILLRKAINVSPTDAASRYQLAELLWQHGTRDEALLQIETAIRLDSSDATKTVRSGEMLLEMGAVDRALERADQALGFDSRLASAWALRGRVYTELDNPKRALADMQRSLQFSPGTADVLLDMASLYRQQGQHQRCLTTLQHLLDSCPPGDEPNAALLLEGQTLADLGRWDDARIRFLAIRQQTPLNADLLYLLAQAEYMTNHRQEATSTVREALLTNASHIPSQQLLAKLGEPTSRSTEDDSKSNSGGLLR